MFFKKYSRVLERQRAYVISKKCSRVLERHQACAVFKKYSMVLERHGACVIFKKLETRSVCLKKEDILGYWSDTERVILKKYSRVLERPPFFFFKEIF